MYKALSVHEAFVDSTQFSGQSSLDEVLEYLMGEMERITSGKWKIERIGGQTLVSQLHIYSSLELEFSAVPLFFLPQLKKSNLPLHNLLVGMVSLLHHKKGILLWEDEEQAVEYLQTSIEEYGTEEYDKEFLQAFAKEKALYTKGQAFYYKTLISDYKVDILQLVKEAQAIQPICPADEKLLLWIKKGLSLFDFTGRMADFVTEDCHTEEDYWSADTSITPFSHYRFLWSYQGLVMENVFENMDATWGDSGEMPFSYYQVIREKKDWYPHPPLFPVFLTRFFTQGYFLTKELYS